MDGRRRAERSRRHQHDETKRLFNFAKKITRKISPDAILHDSVYERGGLAAVLNYDVTEPYCPQALSEHIEFQRRCAQTGAERR